MKEEMRAENQTPPGSLKQQVDTRCNTIYYMLKSVVDNAELIRKVNSEHELNLNILKKDELKLAVDWCLILEPFEEITQMISGSKYVTSSLVLPTIRALIQSLTEMLSGSTEKPCPTTARGKLILQRTINLVTKRLLLKYEGRKVLKLSTLLDPRFKKKGFFYERNYEDGVELLKAQLGEKLRARNQSIVEGTVTPAALKPKKSSGMWNFLDDDDDVDVISNSNRTACDASIIVRNYLEKRRIPLKDDPLQYWNGSDLSTELKDIMLKNFCVPGSSVPVEQLFSDAGLIVTDRRSRLLPQNVQMMAFLSMNYHYYNSVALT